ncbi:MAG TPA: PP2C family protein-serine/threonine phosphatase [Terriglobales bacterium]|nr:PP2C family protein-serine/threonine phosphatase [Terriglobales bacterium]
MSPPSAQSSPFISRARVFLSNQGLFLVVAITLFVILRVTNWPGADFGAILFYSLVAGNLVYPAMNRIAPWASRFPNPYNWVVYEFGLFVVALFSSAAAVIVTMKAYSVPLQSFSTQFHGGGRLGVVVVLIVGTIVHLYHQIREKLEHTSRELTRTLELGKTQSQLQSEELDKAREIQERLLPKKIPQIRGLDVAGAWLPASVVSGDYFDVIKLGEGQIGVCICDVVGKGISAALLMANLQASFRAFANEAASPGLVVARLNEVICSNIASDKFITFCYCILDVTKNTLTYASAGHWPPVLLRRSGESLSLTDGGPPLGLFREHSYQDIELQLQTGDRLVLYTDGLTEARNAEGEEFGEHNVTRVGNQNRHLAASEMLDFLRLEVTAFCQGTFHDDLTLVVVTVK